MTEIEKKKIEEVEWEEIIEKKISLVLEIFPKSDTHGSCFMCGQSTHVTICDCVGFVGGGMAICDPCIEKLHPKREDVILKRKKEKKEVPAGVPV